MKFPAFAYACPTTLSEAISILGGEDGARPLAGGQSLLPMMALRLAAPSLLVDLNRIDAMKGIAFDAVQERLRIGAMMTHAQNAASLDIWMHLPLMSEALHHVAHQAVRNRGTIGGSLAHADAGAEMPLVVTALDGIILLHGEDGERTVPATEFFQGHYTTAIREGEILIGADIPVSDHQWAFEEMARRAGDLAIAMVAVGVRMDGDVCQSAKIYIGGVTDRPVRAVAAEIYLRDRQLTDDAAREAGRIATTNLDVRSDIHASAQFRQSIAATLIRRAFARLRTETV